MAESRATVPTFTLRADGRHDGVRRAARAAEGVAERRPAPLPSYNDLVVKAGAIALREHPRANGAYKDATFEHYARVNVGVAVAAQDALVVPTIFDADLKGLAQIAARGARARRARARGHDHAARAQRRHVHRQQAIRGAVDLCGAWHQYMLHERIGGVERQLAKGRKRQIVPRLQRWLGRSDT